LASLHRKPFTTGGNSSRARSAGLRR